MKETCPYCFELLQNCICIWHTCTECGKRIPESDAYEYRGRVFCEEHDFEEQAAKREYERKQVMEATEASIKSQRIGEFVNNRKKYHLGNVAADGLPIIKPTEPQILRDYERKG